MYHKLGNDVHAGPGGSFRSLGLVALQLPIQPLQRRIHLGEHRRLLRVLGVQRRIRLVRPVDAHGAGDGLGGGGVDAGGDAGQQRAAQARRLGHVHRLDRPAQDVGLGLQPQRRLGAAAHGPHLVDRQPGGLHGVDAQLDLVRHAVDDRLDDLPARGAQGQAEDGALGERVELGGAAADEMRQDQHRRRALDRLAQDHVVRAAAAALRLGDLGAGEGVAVPLQQRAAHRRPAEHQVHAGHGVRLDRQVAAQQVVVEDQLLHRGGDALHRAGRVHHHPLAGRADAQRAAAVIMPAGDGDRAGRQAQLRGDLRRDLAQQRAGRDRGRQPFGVQPGHAQQPGVPRARADVLEHGAGGEAVIHGGRQPHAGEEEVGHAEEARGRVEHRRIVRAQPHQLVGRVHRVRRHAGDVEEALSAHLLLPPAHLRHRARVDGGDEAVDRRARRVHRHDRFAVGGDGQRGDLVAPPAAAAASRTTALTAAHTSAGSSSIQPGCGW